MTLTTYGFPSLGNGVQCTIANCGNTGGTFAPAAPSAQVVGDNTFIAAGSMGIRITSLLNAQSLIRTLAGASNLTMTFGHAIETLASTPANNITLISYRGTGAVACRIVEDTGGKIVVQNAAGTVIGTLATAGTIPGGTLIYATAELTTTASANTGTGTLRLWDQTGTQIGSTVGPLSSQNFGTTAFTGADVGFVDTAHVASLVTGTSWHQYNDGSTTVVTVPTWGSTPVTLTDTGTGDDEITVAAALSFDDPATGTDALTTTATTPLADSGVGTDALATASALPLADTATGTDTVTIAAAAPLADTAAGTDALTTVSAIPLADTGTFTDAISISTGANPSLPDTGTLTDALTVAAAVPLAETAAGTDALVVAATRPLADSATGTDALTLAATRPAADTGAFTDLINTTAALPLTESGAFTDSLSIDKSQQVPLTDVGQFTDTLKTTAAFGLAELGHFTDGLSINKGGSTSRPVTGQQSGHTPAGVTGQTSPARRVTGGSS